MIIYKYYDYMIISKKYNIHANHNDYVSHSSPKDFKFENSWYAYTLYFDNHPNQMSTEDKIKEIKKERAYNDMSKDLPESLANMSMKFNGKTDFTSTDEAFQALKYDRRTQSSEYWCRESVLNYLDLFMETDVVPPFATEQDLLEDMHGFLKKSKNISKTTTVTGCQSSASNGNKNEGRDLGRNERLERQASGDCADLTFKHNSSELGCVEIGLADHGPNGTKELQELKLKCPKMMRSFC